MGKKSNNRGKRATTLSAGNKRGSRSAGRGKIGGAGLGGKSKTKKAKAVKKTLKNINLVNRSKIDNVDKDLVKIQVNVRRNVAAASTTGTRAAVANNKSPPKRGRKGGNTAAIAAALAKREKDFRDLQMNKEDGLKKLDNMDIAK